MFSKKNNLILLSFYLIGIIHWYLFFYYQNPSMYYEDWNFYLQYYNVLKESISNFSLPFHVTLYKSEIYTDDKLIIGLDTYSYGTIRFLAMEWGLLTPQALFLFFLDAKAYVLFNYILFYTLCFIYLIKWSSKFNLSNVALFYLIILFSFNGRIISLTAMGGPQMTFGFMLAPVFFWFFYNFIQNKNKSSLLKLSLFFIFVLSQTDAHITYHYLLICGFTILLYPKRIPDFILVFLLFFLGSLWYILPNIFYNTLSFNSDMNVYFDENHWRNSGICGYGIQNGFVGNKLIANYDSQYFFVNIFYHFVNIFHHIWESLTIQLNSYFHNSHEYNLYIGKFGLSAVSLSAIYSIYLIFKNKNFDLKNYRYIVVFFIIILLSISCTNLFIVKFLQNFISFYPIDAVPSRLMIYPFLFLILFSSFGFSSFKKNSKIFTYFKYALLIIILSSLIRHSYSWWIFSAIEDTQSVSTLEPFIKFYDFEDKQYKFICVISYIVSFLSIASIIGLLIKTKNNF